MLPISRDCGKESIFLDYLVGESKLALRKKPFSPFNIPGPEGGYWLGGVIVVEEVFAFPGIGRQLILAIQNRDLPMLQAGALIMALTYALANLAADLAYASLDKRIQFK